MNDLKRENRKTTPDQIPDLVLFRVVSGNSHACSIFSSGSDCMSIEQLKDVSQSNWCRRGNCKLLNLTQYGCTRE